MTSLPPAQQADCGVYCQTYMQAGAIDFYGRQYGLPRAMSGHNSYWLWGRGEKFWNVMIIVGGSEIQLRNIFGEVEEHARFHDEYIQPTLNNVPIFVARKPKVPFTVFWPMFRFYI